MAGLDGIKRKLDPNGQVSENIFQMDDTTRAEKGIDMLPRSLGEAIDELKCDNNYLKPAFASDALDELIQLEQKEQQEITVMPHPHEFALYFDV